MWINIGYTHSFGPTLTMNANLGVNRYVGAPVTQSFGCISLRALGLLSFIDGIAPSFPEIQPQSYAPLSALRWGGPTITSFRKPSGQVPWILTKIQWQAPTPSFDSRTFGRGIDGGHYQNTIHAVPDHIDGGPIPKIQPPEPETALLHSLMGVGSSTTLANVARTCYQNKVSRNRQESVWLASAG